MYVPHLLYPSICPWASRLLPCAAAAKSLQWSPTLGDPTDGSPPGSAVPGILQARTLEWVAISFCNSGLHAKSLQSCPTLQPHGSSPPGSSVHGILQARTLQWVAISFSSRVLAIVNSASMNSEVLVSFSVTLSARVYVQYWDLLDHMVVLFLGCFFFSLTEISILLSITAVPIYIPTNSAGGLPVRLSW